MTAMKLDWARGVWVERDDKPREPCPEGHVRLTIRDLEDLSYLVQGFGLRGEGGTMLELGLSQIEPGRQGLQFLSPDGARVWASYCKPRDHAADQLMGYVDLENPAWIKT
jgi:hypothetical protein